MSASLQPEAGTTISALTRDFLTWIGGGPRPYTDVMEAWRTSCPRFPIWEDAVNDGFVRLERAPGGVNVLLTERGRAVLEGR